MIPSAESYTAVPGTYVVYRGTSRGAVVQQKVLIQYELGQPSYCQSGGLDMPRSILRIRM